MTPPAHSYRAEQRNALLRARREILTPEGIPISFTLASIGDRAAALLIDLLIILGGLTAIVGLIYATVRDAQSTSWVLPFALILVFLIQNFYFAFFEVRWQGATPGKRRIGLRVIDARGGQLEASAVLARNLMRELELWMPLRFLLGASLYPEAPPWAKVLASVWIFVFLALPLLNKDRLRAGDLVAGTRVVVAPKPVLAADLADTTTSGHALYLPPSMTAAAPPPPPPPAPVANPYAPPGLYPPPAVPAPAPAAAPAPAPAARRGGPMFTFTDAQLGVYGEFELQVLENVLRDTGSVDRDQTLGVVADKIQTKIDFSPRISFGQEERFLREFYAAQRAHLEKRMLFGKRKADKYKK
jgi:uncharacterized RDD family membrane protein YckC